MSKSILNIVSNSYRATLEEQDDTVIWLALTLKTNGAAADLILRGTSVNYGIANQSCKALNIASWKQKNPPDFVRDLRLVHERGMNIFYISEDAAQLGLERHELLEFLHPISLKDLPKIFAQYDYVWQW